MTRTLNLASYLAEQVIKEHFRHSGDSEKEEREILEYCRVNFSPIHMHRVAYRMQRRYVNHIIVATILADLPKLYREIILRKYKKQDMITKISMDLNISIGRITAIDRGVQENIQDMLLYMLTRRDIYSRLKTVNMIHILDLRLSFLHAAPEFTASVSRDWIAALEICREKYRRMYSAMEEIIRKSDTSLHCNIIATKLRQPELTSIELSGICHVSQNGINRHLRTYEADMSKYIVA